jgi:hypothetical protein
MYEKGYRHHPMCWWLDGSLCNYILTGLYAENMYVFPNNLSNL